MESKKDITILISDKALSFVKSRRLVNPIILVGFSSRSAGSDEGCAGDSSGGSRGGGGGCDGGGSSGPPVAYINTLLVDGGTPGADFVKVDTAARIPVYLAKKVYDMAQKSGSTLTVTVRGLVMKKLSLEGLDLSA